MAKLCYRVLCCFLAKQPGLKSGGLQRVVSNAGEGGTGSAVIHTAVRQWHTRLRACVKVKGRHFEHKLSQ